MLYNLFPLSHAMDLVVDLITGSARNVVIQTTLLKVRLLLFLNVDIKIDLLPVLQQDLN